MESNKRCIYPNSIVSGYYGVVDTPIYVEYDQEVETLFQEYQANPAVIKRFDFKMRVAKVSLRLMRDLKRFFINNLRKNDFVSPVVKEFMLDTLRYVKTGNREIPISICKHTVLSATKVTNAYVFNSLKKNFLEELEADTESNGHDLLIKWLSLPNGIEDLIWFNKLIFAPRS